MLRKQKHCSSHHCSLSHPRPPPCRSTPPPPLHNASPPPSLHDPHTSTIFRHTPPPLSNYPTQDKGKSHQKERSSSPSASLRAWRLVPRTDDIPVSPRRHSIASLYTGARRLSVTETVHTIGLSVRNMVNIRRFSRSASAEAEDGARMAIHKNFLKSVLSRHFGDPHLMLSKVSSRRKSVLGEEVTRHEVEFWMRRENCKKPVNLVVKTYKEGRRREPAIYNSIIMDIKNYLWSKEIEKTDDYVCVPPHFSAADIPTTLENLSEFEDMELKEEPEEEFTHIQKLMDNQTKVDPNKILVIENVGCRGFLGDSLGLTGLWLDNEHSVLLVARLARFHAVSFVMRKENNIDMLAEYPGLVREQPAILESGHKEAIRLENIFQQDPKLSSYSGMFLEAVDSEEIQMKLVEPSEEFGVVCHGNVWKGNALFRYASAIDARLYCSDVLFQDASHCYFGSCVLDLLQFFFTSVEPHSRAEVLPDLVASIYYDNFYNTATKIAPAVTIFTKNQFLQEFSNRLMFGFLEGLNLHSSIYKAKTRDGEDGMEEAANELREAVVNMARDVVALRGRVRPKAGP